MALDPKQTFGRVGTSAMPAPQTAKLVPTQSIQGATVAGQAFDKLGDQIAQVGETIRKSGMITDRQQMDERNAERTRLSIEAQGELDAEEMAQGRKYSVDELNTNYKSKLATINGKLAEKYKFSWAVDEADSESKTFDESALAQFQKQKVLPRQAELNRDGLMGEREQYVKAGQAKLSTGDVAGAMELYQQAASVARKPNAVVAWDPHQRAQIEANTLQEGVIDIHSKMKAKDVIVAIDKHAAIEQAAKEANNPALLQASPYRGVDPSFLMKQRESAVGDVYREDQMEKAKLREAQARTTDIFQNDYTTRVRTAMANDDVRGLSKLQAELDGLAKTNKETNGFEGPSLDAITSVQGQIIGAKDRIADRAEARAARAQVKAMQGQMLAQINAQARGAAIENSEDRKLHDKAFDQEAATWSKLTPAQQTANAKEWIARKNYVPDTIRQRIEGGLNSKDPNVIKQALGEMKSIIEATNGQVRPQFSAQAEFYYTGAIRGSASIEQTTENWKNLGKQTKEERADRMTMASTEVKDEEDVVKLMKKGVPNQKMGISGFSRTPDGLEAKDKLNPEVSVPYPPQAIADWRNSYKNYRSYLPAEIATERANLDTFGRGGWATSTTTGDAILRKAQPRSFGVSDEQLNMNLADFKEQHKLDQSTKMVLEPYKMTNDGLPAYHVKYLNSSGLYVYHTINGDKTTIVVQSDEGKPRDVRTLPAGVLGRPIAKGAK